MTNLCTSLVIGDKFQDSLLSEFYDEIQIVRLNSDIPSGPSRSFVFIWPIDCLDACGQPSLSASAAACVTDLAVDAHCLHRRELLLDNRWGDLVMQQLHRDVASVNLL